MTTKRRFFFLCVLSLSTVIVGCSSGVSKEDFLKVKPGMSRDEVELIMGKPYKVCDIMNDFIIMDYMVAGEKWSFNFERDGVVWRMHHSFKRGDKWGKCQ